jgi:hypothetical protein
VYDTGVELMKPRREALLLRNRLVEQALHVRLMSEQIASSAPEQTRAVQQLALREKQRRRNV